jgi:hypothetical protein
MSRWNNEYKDHKDLGRALVGRSMNQLRFGRFPVYKMEIEELPDMGQGVNYSLKIEYFLTGGNISVRDAKVPKETTRMTVPTGEKYGSTSEVHDRLVYEIEKMWENMKENGEKGDMAMAVNWDSEFLKRNGLECLVMFFNPSEKVKSSLYKQPVLI